MTVSLSKVKEFLRSRTVRIILVCILALILLFVCYKVFIPAETGYTPTAEEERLSDLLERVEGVKEASVMIREEDGVAVSAVVVFEGEDGFLLRSKLLEIACTALALEKSEVVVYPAR